MSILQVKDRGIKLNTVVILTTLRIKIMLRIHKRKNLCYTWGSMNKEVIYLEPEDDITDILTRVQQADKKLVALVPPKKATMLRSAVNMKLVARVAKEVEKIVVVVTADPAIMKMAMLARIPVAKTLQSRPVVPTEENLKAAGLESAKDEDVIDEGADEKDSKKDSDKKDDTAKKTDGTKKADADLELDEKSLGIDDGDGKKPKKDKKKDDKKKPDKNAPFWQKYKKQLLIAIPILVALIGVWIWAVVFAPAATITVAISSTANDFSENISFTTDPNAENLEEGVLYAEKQTVSEKYESEFTATGEEDRGQKASGSVEAKFTFVATIDTPINREIPSGSTISTADGKTFTTTSAASVSWNGKKIRELKCDEKNVDNGDKCTVSSTISVVATGAGDGYNTSASTKWKDVNGFTITSSQGTSGGTTDIVKTVRAADISQVVDGLVHEHEQEGKDELMNELSDKLIPIEASYAMETGEVSATPAVGDVVGDNTKPKLTVEVSYSVYTVPKEKIEQYIKQKMELPEGQQIYTIDDLRFERFTAIEDTAKLKASVAVGPIVSEDKIFEMAKGQKTGRVLADLKSISGVVPESVKIQTSYFWVNKIPTKREKVKIILEGEDQPAREEEEKTDQNQGQEGEE